jgi:glutathione peroxidase
MFRSISLAILTLFALGATANAQQHPQGADVNGFYSFTMKTISGQEQALDAYKGKVLLVVNTASECGYTPQYEGLEALYQKYKDRGLRILAFPSNDFGAQEPGSDEEIQTFCSTKYNVTFDLFSKISVKGDSLHPLYAWLTSRDGFTGPVAWNFNKFLLTRDGQVAARYPSKVKPLSDELAATLEDMLGK